MDNAAPALEVGFDINTGASHLALGQLETAMGAAETSLIAHMRRIEAASGGMIKFDKAMFEVRALGEVGGKAMRELKRETDQAERAGEGMARALERQTQTFGKSASEIRNMRAELRAVAAEDKGLTELAARIRSLNAEMNRLEAAGNGAAKSVKGNGTVMAAVAPQAQDMFTQISMGTNVLNVLAIQGGQVASQLTHVGGAAGKFANFMMGPWGLAITAGLLVLGTLTKGLFDNEEAAKKAEEGLKKFKDRQSDIGSFIDDTTGRLKEQNRTLVLNAILLREAEIAENNKSIRDSRDKAFDRARDAAFSAAPAVPGTTTSGVGFRDDKDVQRLIRESRGDVNKLAEGMGQLSRTRPELRKVALDVSTIGGQAIIAARDNKTLREELRALNGDTRAMANGSTAAIEREVALATATTGLATAQARLAMVRAGAAAADKAGGAALIQYRKDLTAATNAVQAAEAAQKAETAARRGAASEQRHAENLAREAEAVKAQTRNLYTLVDAYGVSGEAALIAEARLKAESAAIRARGDIEAMTTAQVGLVLAQRVADSAKLTAAARDEARIQSEVNAQMAEGKMTAEEANQLVRQRIAELPLLAAIEAAQQQGLKAEAERATKALKDQQAAQVALTGAGVGRQFFAQDKAANDRLADLREELRLIGATDRARTLAMARVRAERDAAVMFEEPGPFRDNYIQKQIAIADAQFQLQVQTRAANDELEHQGVLLDTIATNASNAARGMADAFGETGRALGDLGAIFAGHIADQKRLTDARDRQLRQDAQIDVAAKREAAQRRTNALFAARTATAEVGYYGDMAAAAKGFFGEKSKGYAALSIAEKAFRAVEFALSVRAVAQDAIETGAKIATTVARTAVRATEAVVSAIGSLPFPLNLAAGAATAAAIGSLGVSIAGSFGGSSRNRLERSNDGSGSVLGDSKAQSESIKRAVDQLREVDTLTNAFAREMAASLKSIDSQIGGVASAIVRAGDINASGGVSEGFKSDTTGKLLQGIVTGGGLFSKVPIIGGIISGVGSLLGSLFGSSTSVIGSGLYGKSQTLGSILGSGFDAQTYSDIEKKKKFLGITTGKSYSTQYAGADPALEAQFTLLLRSFSNAIGAAAGPLGESTAAVEARLNGFVVNIGKIDLKGLTGEQIAEKLTAVFGKAADDMADAAFPGIARFQKVGEGAFETLVRVASTVEAVTVSLDQLGLSTRALGLDAKIGIADQFDSVSAMTSAADSYFRAFYTPAEQNAARMAQLNGVFVRLGVTMPATTAAFRALVEAQDLTTAAGQSTYATLLQLAPAFAQLKSAMDNAKSAADVLAEREGLQRRLLELEGNTAAIRALDLAKLDASNRALQQQIYAIEDAKEAARAADELRQAWSSVGESIADEVKRIRGLDTVGGGGFAALLGQFNAATASARGGDIDAAKSLPGLSQALLKAAAEQATSRQELARIQAQTAASLEATQAAVAGRSTPSQAAMTAAILSNSAAVATVNQSSGNDDTASAAAQIDALQQEIANMRADMAAALAAIASNTGKAARVLEDVTAQSGGDAITVASAAA